MYRLFYRDIMSLQPNLTSTLLKINQFSKTVRLKIIIMYVMLHQVLSIDIFKS